MTKYSELYNLERDKHEATMDALEKAVGRSAKRDAISRAVHKERERCLRIAESFVQDSKTDGEVYIARRIAEVIRTGPVR